jgi:hypothetical protein
MLCFSTVPLDAAALLTETFLLFVSARCRGFLTVHQCGLAALVAVQRVCTEASQNGKETCLQERAWASVERRKRPSPIAAAASCNNPEADLLFWCHACASSVERK